MPVCRAKVKCVAVTQREGWGKVPIVFHAEFAFVSGGSEENKAFWEATPSGTLKLDCTHTQFFEVGKEYYLDFTKVA